MKRQRNASILATAVSVTVLLGMLVAVVAVADDNRPGAGSHVRGAAPPAPVGPATAGEGRGLSDSQRAIAQTVAAGALTMAAICFGFLGILIVETPAIEGAGASKQARRRLFSLTIYCMGADVGLSVFAAVAALLALARDDDSAYRVALAIGLLACCLLVAAATYLVAEVAFDRWRSRHD